MALPPSASTVSGVNVSRESLERLEAYVGLLLEWQPHINLIGDSTTSDIWQRHIADAVQLLPYLPAAGGELADLGSGAGIPGLVVAIATGRRTHLYESNRKKTAFLRQAIRVTGANAEVHDQRIENLQPSDIPPVAAVTARALAPLPKLLDLAFPFLDRGAIGLFHKGQDVEVELAATTKYWNVLWEKHQNPVDSRGVILIVKEATRVDHRGETDPGRAPHSGGR